MKNLPQSETKYVFLFFLKIKLVWVLLWCAGRNWMSGLNFTDYLSACGIVVGALFWSDRLWDIYSQSNKCKSLMSFLTLILWVGEC